MGRTLGIIINNVEAPMLGNLMLDLYSRGLEEHQITTFPSELASDNVVPPQAKYHNITRAWLERGAGIRPFPSRTSLATRKRWRQRATEEGIVAT